MFEIIGIDITCKILEELSIDAILNIRTVYKYLKKCIENDNLWKILYEREFITSIFKIGDCFYYKHAQIFTGHLSKKCWKDKFVFAWTCKNISRNEYLLHQYQQSQYFKNSLKKLSFSNELIEKADMLVSKAASYIERSKMYECIDNPHFSKALVTAGLCKKAHALFEDAKNIVCVMTLIERKNFEELQLRNISVSDTDQLITKKQYELNYKVKRDVDQYEKRLPELIQKFKKKKK